MGQVVAAPMAPVIARLTKTWWSMRLQKIRLETGCKIIQNLARKLCGTIRPIYFSAVPNGFQRIKGHLAPRIVHLRHYEPWLLIPTL